MKTFRLQRGQFLVAGIVLIVVIALTLTGTTAALTAASTTVPVTSTAGYAPYGRLLIDSELINYTSTTGTNFNGLTRGVGGTTAAAHAAGVTVSQNLCKIGRAH